MKLTFKEFGEFLKKLDAKSPELRAGQYFCNLYNITDPALFYEQDTEKAIGLIMDNYLEIN